MTALQELGDAARTVAGRLAPSVVSIGRGGRGTGLVVAPNRVLTNAHNLRDRTTTVAFADGRSVQGQIAGVDVDSDLVVLEADTADAPAVEWSERAVQSGDVVFGVGRAGGRLRVTFGLVTTADATFRGPRGRKVRGALEHDAALARGSSGGPVTDADGRVLGINTHRNGPGFYAARPADDELRTLVERLASGESISRRTLGVALAPPHVARRLRRAVGLPERDGLLVRGVVDDSPAARAGLTNGDLLVRANDRELDHPDTLHEVLDSLADDATLTLAIVRGVDEQTVTVSFAADASVHQGQA
jgi:S1-C subfamily serine protease